MFIKQAIFFIYYIMSNPNPSEELPYITGEIYIDKNRLNQNIQIINSYDNYMNYYFSRNRDYNNQKEIEENVKIEIDDKELKKFSYFYNFSEIGKYKIKYSFKKKLKKLNHLFCKCSQLTALDFSYYDTSDAIQVNSIFEKCSLLKQLNLNNFDTKNVRNMENMFCYCENLEELNLLNFETILVTNMKYMFFDCFNLKSIKIDKNFNTSLVTNMNSMFGGCEKLTNLDLTYFNTENVYCMMEMFSNCKSLTDLDLSKFCTKKVKYFDRMFSCCSSLKSLNLSNFIIDFTPNDSIDMKYMFFGCESLKNFIYKTEDNNNITDITKYSLEKLKNQLIQDLKNTHHKNIIVNEVDNFVQNEENKESLNGSIYEEFYTINIFNKSEPKKIYLNGNNGNNNPDDWNNQVNDSKLRTGTNSKSKGINSEESKNEKKREKSAENGESGAEKTAGSGCQCPCLII